jgi:hypothetical protein
MPSTLHPAITRHFTTTIEITAVPKRAWTLENGSIEPIPGYSILFPDGHIRWLEADDFERYYLAHAPTYLLDK